MSGSGMLTGSQTEMLQDKGDKTDDAGRYYRKQRESRSAERGREVEEEEEGSVEGGRASQAVMQPASPWCPVVVKRQNRSDQGEGSACGSHG